MKKSILFLIVLVINFLLVGCKAGALPTPDPGPCNNDTLEKVLRSFTNIGDSFDALHMKFMEVYMRNNGFSYHDPHWEISPRGENGCEILLVVEQNGREINFNSYFLDTSEEYLQISGDDEYSRELLLVFDLNAGLKYLTLDN